MNNLAFCGLRHSGTNMLRCVKILIIVLILSPLMILSLTGCGGNVPEVILYDTFPEESDGLPSSGEVLITSENQPSVSDDSDASDVCNNLLNNYDENVEVNEPAIRGRGLTQPQERPVNINQPEERPDEYVIAHRMYSTDVTYFNLSAYHPFGTSEYFEGLRHFWDLTGLSLFDNRVDDLSMISGLTNLRTLNLSRNQISDLSPLAGLTALTTLNVSHNQLSDLTPLAGLTNLTTLIICGNSISDLSPLAGLTNLNVLEAGDNQIYDLTPLESLVNLQELLLDNNRFSNISALLGLENLRYVSLEGNSFRGASLIAAGNNAPSADLYWEVGDIIEFGDLSWVVLDIYQDYALIITEYVQLIGVGRYNHFATPVTWQTSVIRHILNNEFFYRFKPSERARIQETLNVNENNPWFGVNGGYDTVDRVFMLSISEVIRYFGDSGLIHTRPEDVTVTWFSDAYDSARISRFHDGNRAFWWLRTPGNRMDLASGVDATGAISVFGTGVSNSTLGARPAMWIRIN